MNEQFFDLSRPRRVHVVGIGGPGMNAIATCLAQMGHDVTGSDIRESDVVDRMRALGIRVNVGHDAEVVRDREVVTSSTAIPVNNIERALARSLGVPDLTRAEML
ncbi:MAG: UDP-N-acetylmuramate--L-alanine ligase, partial [Actinomycetota bacterium]